MSDSQDPRTPGQKIADPGASLRLDMARQQALDLKAKDFTYRQIAEAMGVSVSTAYQYVNDGWKRINEDSDDVRRVLRAVEDDRLEQLLEVSMPIALGESEMEDAAENILKAQDMVLKISKRKAQMFGLDAPREIKITKGKSQIEPLAVLRERAKQARLNREAVARQAVN